MKNTADIVQRIGEYEKAGLSRDQAIEIIKIEQLIIIGNRLTAINKSLEKEGD